MMPSPLKLSNWKCVVNQVFCHWLHKQYLGIVVLSLHQRNIFGLSQNNLTGYSKIPELTEKLPDKQFGWTLLKASVLRWGNEVLLMASPVWTLWENTEWKLRTGFLIDSALATFQAASKKTPMFTHTKKSSKGRTWLPRICQMELFYGVLSLSQSWKDQRWRQWGM